MSRNNSNLSAMNSFEGGLVADLNVMVSPGNTVTDALNMELVTMGDNQYVYQNIRGNKLKHSLPQHQVGQQFYDFIPLGVKVNNNIAYILAGAFDNEGEFLMGMVGTYPSPNWEQLNGSTKTSQLYPVFSALKNYKPAGGTTYTNEFKSDKFNFTKNRHIDMEIQGDFDGSVNIIFTDNKGNLGLINSRFKRTESDNVVKLADRNGENDSNIYTDDDWDRIALIQNANYPIVIQGPVINPGGYLKGGGYRYYFKYITAESNTTELLYESALIPIANNGLGLTKDQVSDKTISFTLSNLDKSYAGIRVFFAHFDGKDEGIMEVFKINFVYSFGISGEVTITHTGLEDVTPVDTSEINMPFTPIDTVKTTAIINDRLAIAGVSSTISEDDIDVLKLAAESMFIWEKTMTVEKSYADPETAAKYLGHWKGEVYELGAVFMLLNKGLSPAFPITGMDNIDGIQTQIGSSYLSGEYPIVTDLEDILLDGFSNTNMINKKGIFRTSNKGSIYDPLCDGDGRRHVTYFEVDSSRVVSVDGIERIATGFFIVRRKRIKNVLFQGMAVPTLKLPAKPPGTHSPPINNKLASIAASKRYLLKYYKNSDVTIGLNAPFVGSEYSGKAVFNIDFDVVFVPQPTPIINVLTYEKSWAVNGMIGQAIGTHTYGTTVDNTGANSGFMHVAIYSPELELAFPNIKGHLSGVDPALEIQGTLNSFSPIASTFTGESFKSEANIIVKGVESIRMDRAAWFPIPHTGVKAVLMESGVASYSNNSFSAKTDRALGFIATNITSTVEDTDDPDPIMMTYGLPYLSYDPRSTSLLDKNILWNSSMYRKVSDSPVINLYHNVGSALRSYSVISQSYSAYLGVTLDSKYAALPTFGFGGYPRESLDLMTNGSSAIDCVTEISERKYINTGHLVNVFRSATGRWGRNEIVSIYKHDSNKVYNTVSQRFPIDANSVDVFRGDGFISKIYKRTSYKNGIPEARSATASDAADYGIGVVDPIYRTTDGADVFEANRDDKGRNLFDVGQIIEIVSFSNINADIRSTEKESDADSLLYGGDRDFYPNREHNFGDARPDSTAYNHGYTGDINPISYSRIEAHAPTFNTEFPNRVLISEVNKTQGFYNSFRDLKGFNYRDYGVSLGPIVKLVSIKNILLTIHPSGVLAIGVDDKTLVAEGSDVYVNTAEALSPTAKTISEMYGATHAEAIANTDTTIIGVDYNANVAWMFDGDKLLIISEFAVKTVLAKFKEDINTHNFSGSDSQEVYNPRVYTTFNNAKHTAYISYVAEHPRTKEQTHVGTITYNTVLNKWVSRISEGNKFSMSIGSTTITTGYSNKKGLWEEDMLFDINGKSIRARLRGVDYPYEFEIVVNKEPSVEKILNNILMITNKSIPVEIVYTTSGEDNDAAVDIWGKHPGLRVIKQKIVTRNNSARKHLRLGILDENAYYKNSDLYIEVGKIDSVMRSNAGNRRIRDKAIKIRFIYTGNNETFLQGIISMLNISYS